MALFGSKSVREMTQDDVDDIRISSEEVTPMHFLLEKYTEAWSCPKCRLTICKREIDYTITRCPTCNRKVNWYNAYSLDKERLGI